MFTITSIYVISYLQLKKVDANLSQANTFSYKFFRTNPSKLNKNFLEIHQPFSEAATGGVPYKKLFLKVLQYSQENNCVGVSVLIKLQTFKLATLLKRGSNTGAFLQFLRTPILKNKCEWLFLSFHKMFSKNLLGANFLHPYHSG